ncbi:MAG: hypothetical protein LBD24_03435 [Spirochaetaceae bacterium]|nr:hypothetical protein [Spirochaetaceae bacterium]
MKLMEPSETVEQPEAAPRPEPRLSAYHATLSGLRLLCRGIMKLMKPSETAEAAPRPEPRLSAYHAQPLSGLRLLTGAWHEAYRTAGGCRRRRRHISVLRSATKRTATTNRRVA